MASAKEDDGTMFIVKDTHVIAFIIFLLSFIGTFVNAIVAFFTRKLPAMNNPFGKLTASQATGETVICATFAFYIAPMLFFNIDMMEESSRHAGFINLIFYDICIWSHLFIAVNRLIAICFPVKYNNIFSDRNTQILIVISWIIPIITAVVLFKLHPCDLFFSTKFWAYIFTQNEICDFISWDIDFYKDVFIVSVIATVDVITILNVKRLSKSNATTSDEQIKRRMKEINFLKQAVLQGIVFLVELINYFIIAWKFENKWIIFCFTTLSWISVHAIDGIIIISFNQEFRRVFCCSRAAHKQSSVANISANHESIQRMPQKKSFSRGRTPPDTTP